MDSPQFIDSSSFSTLLGREPLEFFRALSSTRFQYGREHSLYVNRFLEKVLPSRDPSLLLPMFRDVERFDGEIDLRSFWASPVNGQLAGKLIDGSLVPSLDVLGRIQDIRAFAGNEGDRSSLHFDWNPFPNILYNLTGKKTIRLFSPLLSRELGGYSNFSFNHSLKATQTFELQAGDAIRIPPWWWHEVEYQTKACSLSIRLDAIPENIPSLEGRYPSWKFLLNGKSLSAPSFHIQEIENELNHQIGHHPDDDHPFYLFWAEGFNLFMNGVMAS